MHSIGIEVCEVDGAEQAAIELITKMLKERGWGIDRVKKHQDWSGKNCPRLIIPHWGQFISSIQAKLQGGNIVKVIVTYFGDGDLFAAVLVSQKMHCPLMSVDDFRASGIKAEKVIQIGGKPGTDRFNSFKDAANLI
jgi:hypothetical protein